jgi:hypothetical protein
LGAKSATRLEERPVKKSAPEASKAALKAKTEKSRELADREKASRTPPPASSPAPPAGWWRPLFYAAAVPASLLAASSLGGVAVESPVWLLGPEGCAMASRRSLAMLLGIRGRAAVRWQESVSGVDGRMIAIGKRYEGRVTRTFDEEDLGPSRVPSRVPTGSVASSASTQEAAASSWSALLERRNRQPVTIGLGLCVLAAFSGSNTVIYYASSVLKEAGVDDPNVLTYAVGVPNLLGGLIALAATDSYGRRPLLLLSFGGMTACLAALSVAAALTSGGGGAHGASDVAGFCAAPDVFYAGFGGSGGSGAASRFFSPEATSGLPCVTCDFMAAICGDLPEPALPSAPFDPASLEPRRTVALVTIPAYTLLFSLGAGPVPWLLYNEVFPTRIRARATAVCTAINYAANTVVGASFLPLVAAGGLEGTYALYAAMCGAGFVFVDRLVFETKGLKLEDVEGVMAEREERWAAEREEKERGA